MEVERKIWRKRSDCNLWKRRTHLRAIAGIVVDEHERINADVQLARDIGEIERLRIPVDAHSGEVVFVKKHTRIAQRRRNVFWIVLRERNENNAALLEHKRLALKQLVGLDGVYAVFANDALP